MRAIDADKLKEEINNIKFDSEWYFYMEDILDHIDEQPTVNQWIPCSERLPENQGFYNVTLKFDKNAEPITEYCFYDSNSEKWKFIADGNMRDNTTWEEETNKVIAWQPLPEPYKGE